MAASRVVRMPSPAPTSTHSPSGSQSDGGQELTGCLGSAQVVLRQLAATPVAVAAPGWQRSGGVAGRARHLAARPAAPRRRGTATRRTAAILARRRAHRTRVAMVTRPARSRRRSQSVAEPALPLELRPPLLGGQAALDRAAGRPGRPARWRWRCCRVGQQGAEPRRGSLPVAQLRLVLAGGDGNDAPRPAGRRARPARAPSGRAAAPPSLPGRRRARPGCRWCSPTARQVPATGRTARTARRAGS